jgi:hypothetical protein
MLERLRVALCCAVLAAATGVAIQAILLLHTATVAASALPAAVGTELAATRTALLAELQASRGELVGQVEAARRDLLGRTERQVAALRKDAISEVAQIRSIADRRVGDTLARMDTALGEMDELRADLKPALVHATSITKQVDDAAPLFLDCEYNPDCVFNRYVGVSKGIELAAMNFGQMSSDVRAALPTTIATWQGIGTNVDGITANINRLTKPRWYDRLLGYGLNGVVIYRNLNPATNLTIKGAQLVSSRPQ